MATVTAASDLLVHKILLISVLLSSIVCGGVRPKLPGQTPLGHDSLCFFAVRGSGRRLVGFSCTAAHIFVSPGDAPANIMLVLLRCGILRFRSVSIGF